MLEEARLVEQLARVDDVQPLHGRRLCAGLRAHQLRVYLAVKSLDDVDGLRHLQQAHLRHRQAGCGGHPHGELLQECRGWIGLRVGVVWLEDMRRGCGPDRLVEVRSLHDNQQLVLCAGHGHAFGRLAAQRRPRQLLNALAQDRVAQRLQRTVLRQRHTRRHQGEGASRLRAQVLQQSEGIVLVLQAGFRGGNTAQFFLRQQVVEVPLHGAQGGSVQVAQGGAGQCW
jgi:hypothetical protein